MLGKGAVLCGCGCLALFLWSVAAQAARVDVLDKELESLYGGQGTGSQCYNTGTAINCAQSQKPCGEYQCEYDPFIDDLRCTLNPPQYDTQVQATIPQCSSAQPSGKLDRTYTPDVPCIRRRYCATQPYSLGGCDEILIGGVFYYYCRTAGPTDELDQHTKCVPSGGTCPP